MANPHAGEVDLVVNGERRVLKLTLGALAEMENDLEGESFLALIGRIERAEFTSRDVLALIVAGLRGGGWQGGPEDLRTAEIAGGPLAAARVAAHLLAVAFTLDAA